MTAAKHDILQGWKDIAAYVSRDVRTVRRWEKQRGLPVRRMPGDGRANVYALVDELDAWILTGVAGRAESGAEIEAPDLSEDLESEPLAAQVIELPASPANESAPPQAESVAKAGGWLSQRRWVAYAAAGLCVGALSAFALHLRTVWVEPALRTKRTTEVRSDMRRPSRVKGVEELYLQGIYFYEQRTPETLDRALRCFHEAVARDPSYAPAYAGLAQTYNLVRQYSMMPDAEAYKLAEAAAEKAIELDPSLPDAHASLGFIEFFWRWDPVAAEREFHTAIKLDPGSGLAHHWYGSMLTHQGRFNESLTELELAQRLDPTSTSILGDKAFTLALAGHAPEARAMLQEVLNEDPKSPAPHYIMAVISQLAPRDMQRYLSEIRHVAQLRHDAPQLRLLDETDAAFRAGGEHAMWRAMLAGEERAQAASGVRTYRMARAECMLGMKDACLRDIAQLVQARDPLIVGLHVEPAFEVLQGDPRFSAIVERVGLNRTH